MPGINSQPVPKRVAKRLMGKLMAKKKKTMKKKEMSEGTAIAIVVIGLTIGGIVAYYLFSWLLNQFFPNLL